MTTPSHPSAEAMFLRELADECERSGTEFGKGRAFGIREALDSFRSAKGDAVVEFIEAWRETDSCDDAYRDGWNQCRSEMLAAAKRRGGETA